MTAHALSLAANLFLFFFLVLNFFFLGIEFSCRDSEAPSSTTARSPDG